MEKKDQINASLHLLSILVDAYKKGLRVEQHIYKLAHELTKELGQEKQQTDFSSSEIKVDGEKIKEFLEQLTQS